jgi:hypothetical protein
MKKILAILAISMLTLGTAQADSVGVEAGNVNINKGQAHQEGIGLRYSKDIARGFSADIGVQSLKNTASNAATSRVELGATASMPLAKGLGFYARVTVGEQFGSWARETGKEFKYWSVEPGVAYRTGNFDVRAGYRWRDSFDAITPGFKTDTYKLGAGYSLSKTDRVGINYEDVRGNYKAKQYTVNYTRSF